MTTEATIDHCDQCRDGRPCDEFCEDAQAVEAEALSEAYTAACIEFGKADTALVDASREYTLWNGTAEAVDAAHAAYKAAEKALDAARDAVDAFDNAHPAKPRLAPVEPDYASHGADWLSDERATNPERFETGGAL